MGLDRTSSFSLLQNQRDRKWRYSQIQKTPSSSQILVCILPLPHQIEIFVIETLQRVLKVN